MIFCNNKIPFLVAWTENQGMDHIARVSPIKVGLPPSACSKDWYHSICSVLFVDAIKVVKGCKLS
jgi:hypothetical protein